MPLIARKRFRTYYELFAAFILQIARVVRRLHVLPTDTLSVAANPTAIRTLYPSCAVDIVVDAEFQNST